MIGYHLGDTGFFPDQILDHHTLNNASAKFANAFSIGLGQGVGINVTIIGNKGSANKIAHLHQRVYLLRFRRCHHVHFKTDCLSRGVGFLQLFPAVGRVCNTHAADLSPAWVLAGFFEQHVKQFYTVIHQAHEVLL